MTNDKWKMLNPVKVDDSKKLTSKQREKSAIWIKQNALSWGIGESSATLINQIVMAKATRVAFRKAIINGDEKSYTIGAASIVAKVYRDKLMVGLGKRPKFKKYGGGEIKDMEQLST